MENELLKELRYHLQIDQNDLDKECSKQPVIFWEIEEEVAKAISIRDSKKEQLLQIDAKLSFDHREESEKLGSKTTEAKLSQLVILDPLHLKVVKELAEAKFEADQWLNLKEAFIQRASMLKELCSLYLANYYTRIEVKGNSSTQDLEASYNRKILADKRAAR